MDGSAGKFMVIDSIKNEKIKGWSKLKKKKYRDETGLFLIEEDHLIREALSSNIVEALIMLKGIEDIFKFKKTYLVSEAVINYLSTNVSNSKYIAVCHKFKNTIESTRILILDGIQDPGNMGTILRGALSFGFNKIICSNECVDIYNEKTLRSSQGAIFKLDIIRKNLLEEIKNIKSKDYTIMGLTLNNSSFISQVKASEKMAFVLGNEGQGISNDIEKACDLRVKIEMDKFESLNVAMAASIAMYLFRV